MAPTICKGFSFSIASRKRDPGESDLFEFSIPRKLGKKITAPTRPNHPSFFVRRAKSPFVGQNHPLNE
jgi:hypothetical protein